jgi:hypothetical protein
VHKSFFFDCFCNIDKAAKVYTPVLILHGTKDSIVPLSDGEALAKLIPREFLYELYKVENGDHNDLFKNHKARIFKKIREFLNHISKINFQEFSKIENENRKTQHEETHQLRKEDRPVTTLNIIKEIFESEKQEAQQHSRKESYSDGQINDTDKMDENIDELKSEDIALHVKSLTVNKSESPNKSKI